MGEVRGRRRMFTPSDSNARVATAVAAGGFASIAVFELALAMGAPLGHAAWGGANARLSTGQRFGSGAAVLAWSAAALIVLGRAGLWSVGRRQRLFSRGTWFLGGLSVVAALMNFASGSRWENLIFGPTAVALAALCFLVATDAPRTPSPRQ